MEGLRYFGISMHAVLHSSEISRIIRLAWEDRTTFEEIHAKTGLREREVILLMRRELKPSSFRLWRKRVSGRVTKHGKLMQQRLAGPSWETGEGDSNDVSE